MVANRVSQLSALAKEEYLSEAKGRWFGLFKRMI
jgi:hypothetical protein